MIRFVDLKSGSTYNGESPYMHYPFGSDGLSCGIPIVGKMCFLSDQGSVNVSLDENPVYSLLDPGVFETAPDETINEFQYKDLEGLEADALVLQGVPLDDMYIYMVYILGNADEAGEWTCDIVIDGTAYAFSGDWYEEDERLWINASNMGFEVPDQIQKTFYQTNVHEDLKDPVILNRKYKELLSNYWDLLAGKGSYKSLRRSLSWFEWGDRVRLEELWKRYDLGRENYWSQDLSGLLTEEFRKTLFATAKSTYIALYCAKTRQIERISDDWSSIYDQEKNPKLEWISHKWSWEDLMLKMTLLGNFFETYFTPIHLDLIHSTLEDVVFTNVIKSIQGSILESHSLDKWPEAFECDIKDGHLFVMDDVQCQVGPNTLFATPYASGQDWDSLEDAVGVDEVIEGSLTGSDIRTFWAGRFGGPGCIAEFTVKLPELYNGDMIKKETLIVEDERGTRLERQSSLLLPQEFSFRLLFKSEGIKTMHMTFESMDGRIFVKDLRIEVRDISGLRIDIYKIGNKDPQLLVWDSPSVPSYMLTRHRIPYNDSWEPVYQYVPGTALGLNRTYIIRTDKTAADLPSGIIQSQWFVGEKTATVDPITGASVNNHYIILISKEYGDNVTLSREVLEGIGGDIIRNDMSYIPWFHEYVAFGNQSDVTPSNESLDNYTIDDTTTLCLVPQYIWGHEIEECEWIFRNVSKDPHGEGIQLPSTREPMIGNTVTKALEKGFYDIEFRFKMVGDGQIHSLILKSAFRKI